MGNITSFISAFNFTVAAIVFGVVMIVGLIFAVTIISWFDKDRGTFKDYWKNV